MADLNDVIRALRQTADELDQEIPALLLEQEITAKSLVQDRIQEKGLNAQGKKLGDYSNTKVPAFWFIGKGSRATDAKLKVLSDEGKYISYSDFRKLDGKQEGYVDLTFTGQMWRETGLTKQNVSQKQAVIVIGQTTKRSEDIAKYNEERYGNFLELSDEELLIITEDMKSGVEEIINKNLTGLK